MRRIAYTFLFLCITVSYLTAQKSVGQWNTYLAYYTTTKVAESNNYVYAVADGSLYSYNKEDNSITHYSRKTGLSDTDITQICFNPNVNALVIVYKSGNIDLLGEYGIYNLPYFRDNSNVTDKTVNNIYIDNEYAYLSTQFGIIVLNMDKKEIKDTYKLNKNVFSVAVNNNYIYAATPEGVKRASMDSNLLDYNVWTAYPLSSSEFNQNNISRICFFQNVLCFYVNQGNKGVYYRQNDGTIKNMTRNGGLSDMVLQNDKLMLYTNSELYIYSSLTDRDIINVGVINNVTSFKDPNTFWIASGTNGIKGIQKKNGNYETILESTASETESPKRNYNYFMTTNEDKLYVVGGGRWTDRLNIPGTLMIYDNEKWFNLDESEVNKIINQKYDFEGMDTPLTTKDYTGIAIDPKDPTHYYVSIYGEGIMEFKDNEFIELYNHTNSSLSTIYPNGKPNQRFNYNRIGGVTFDKEGNLWITNCEVKEPIKVLKADGTWTTLSYDYNDFSNVHMVDKIMITSTGQKWVNVPYGSESGIFIFNDNKTIDDISDDKYKFYPTFPDINGKDNIEASGYFCCAEDKNGQIWIGTNRGPILCANPRNIEKLACTRIIRPADETVDEPYAFLDGERINAIVVDGGNRKWIGTNSSGVFLVSEDGMETIANFRSENSPLPSNLVNSITINERTGEVFIGTDKGLVSYMGDATEGKEDYSDVYAYPNPVRPEYSDQVMVVGLMDNSNVKITDLRGNIIYQGKSNGGTFSWNCRNRSGSRVATGVYLVLSSTPEAKESVVTKIMVVK